ncbi:MAG: hypothetical protein ACI8V2_002064 [Candidatus Latescibacterota bacterium]|jgi:hypothetical protein
MDDHRENNLKDESQKLEYDSLVVWAVVQLVWRFNFFICLQ